VYVIDFLILYFGNVRALVLVDVCIMKHLPRLMSAAMEVSGCRSWNLFSFLFLHFTQAGLSMWAVLLQVNVASEVVCLRLLSQAGLDSFRDCSP